jgi:hypothetical protein
MEAFSAQGKTLRAAIEIIIVNILFLEFKKCIQTLIELKKEVS